MGNYKRGNLYWTNRHEELVKQWLSATTEIQYTRIHNDLRTTLNHMGELILNRYYAGLNSSQQTELKQDAINFLFLKFREFNPEKGTAYNFCGMILKRYYYDVLVLKNDRLYTMYDKIDYLDDLPEEATPVQYEQNKIDYDMVLHFFKKLLYKLELDYKIAMKNNPRYKPAKTIRYITLTKFCIEYIEKYENFSPAPLADYLYIHSGYKSKQLIVYFFKKMLNLNLGKNSISFESTEKAMSDDKYNYIMDDHTPNINKWYNRDKRRKLKLKRNDYNQYSYF